MRAGVNFQEFLSRSVQGLLTVVSMMTMLCGFGTAAEAQTQPGVVSQVTQLGALGGGGFLSGGSPAGGSLGVNSLGNVIASSTYGGTIMQFSATGVVTSLGAFSNPGPVAVDSANNVYVGGTYGGTITKIPFVNGMYVAIPTSGATPVCTGTDTAVCNLPNPLAGTSYNIGGLATMVFDKAGNLYLGSTNGGSNPNAVFVCSVACLKNASATPAVRVYQEPTSTTAQLYVGGLAADAAGNVFFTDSATNGNLHSTVSNLKEVAALTPTTFAATPVTLYTFTPAAPSDYDDQLGAVSVDANNVYFGTENGGVFAMPNASGVVNKAGLFTVSNAGAKLMTTDGAGNFYVGAYTNGGDGAERISVGLVNAPSTAVGSSATVPNVTVYVNDTTCSATPAAAATFTSSTSEFSATLGKACVPNSVTNAATFASTVTFTPGGGGTRTATLTGKDQASMTFTFVASGIGSGGSTTNVATPTFSPAGGTYSATQTVALADATSGSSIYYTTDGSTPTTSSKLYTGPITVAVTTTINALGVASGSVNSAVGTATYTIVLPAAATPTFMPGAGTYTSVQAVTISTTTPGATIYYTTNGTAPATTSMLYTGPVSVGASETLMAIATATGFSQSAAGAAAYVINLPPAAAPAFSVAGGTYSANQSVALSDATANAVIYYTLDGSAPTTKSTVYTTPISVSVSETINAIATAPNFSTSASSAATYMLVTAAPTFSPAAGTYTSAQTVTLADATVGAAIYYTTNGSAPTTASMLYTGPITVGASETIMAIASNTGYGNSAVSSAAYVINVASTVAAATPTFSPAGGTYGVKQTVTIASTTPGAMIYYTTNGSAPTTSSTVYMAPITVAVSETVNAVAVATGYLNSAMGTAVYTISPAVPTFSVAINPSALTVTDGSSGTVAVSITPTAGYSSAVTLSCTGLPAGSTCAFAPATVTPSGTAASTSTLTIAAAARTSSLEQPEFGAGSVASGTVFAAMLCLLGFRKRRRVQLFLLLLVGVIGLGMMTGCSGGATISHNAVTTNVTVTATDGTQTSSTVLSLTVN